MLDCLAVLNGAPEGVKAVLQSSGSIGGSKVGGVIPHKEPSGKGSLILPKP